MVFAQTVHVQHPKLAPRISGVHAFAAPRVGDADFAAECAPLHPCLLVVSMQRYLGVWSFRVSVHSILAGGAFAAPRVVGDAFAAECVPHLPYLLGSLEACMRMAVGTLICSKRQCTMTDLCVWRCPGLCQGTPRRPDLHTGSRKGSPLRGRLHTKRKAVFRRC